MEYRNEDNITCPYCGHVDEQSWEFGGESGDCTCTECDKEFHVEIETSITYSTSRVLCEALGEECTYVYESKFIKDRKYVDGDWLPLDKTEYVRIEKCSKCDDCIYPHITKEEYFNL